MSVSRFVGAYLGSLLGGSIGNAFGYFADSVGMMALSIGVGAFLGIALADYAVEASLAKGLQGMVLGIRKGLAASAGGIAGFLLGGITGMFVGPLIGLIAGELIAALIS